MSFVVWMGVMLIMSLSSLLSLWVLGGLSICFEIKVVGVSSEMLDVLLVLDYVSLSFVSLVLFISGCVFFYSSSYMSSSEMSSRLKGVMAVFVLSMILLVMFPSLLGLILGWDGLGLSSFLLVVFYQNDRSLASGMITALSNRVGDGLLIVAMGVCLSEGHWCGFYEVSMLVSLLIGLASMTKSAQVPFCAWLPAAMAAPTPVSSLVHSSTLVTAGVYLLLRYMMVSNVSDILVVVGSMTMIMGGMSAMYEADVKKIVALSTLSQLGMMVFVVSLGFQLLCVFHVYMHALLKASLFMGVGAMIHGRNEQSVYLMGGGSVDSPGSSSVIIVTCASLSGIPFLCGWFSKDMILEAMLGGVSWVYSVVLFVGAISSVAYSGRVIWMSVFSPIGFSSMSQTADCKIMLLSISILLSGLLLGGPLLRFWLGVSSVTVLSEVDKLAGMIIVFSGILFVFMWFGFSSINFSWLELGKINKSLWLNFRSLMWFMPAVSSEVGSLTLLVSNSVFWHLEQGWVEIIGGKGVLRVGELFLSIHRRNLSGGYNMWVKLLSVGFLVVLVLSLLFWL